MHLRGLVPSLLTATALGVSMAALPATSARASFDGAWSVLIVTDAGSCDRAYRYALRIANGKISYDDPSFGVGGRVDSGGHVNVTVSAGGQSARGSGQLSGNYGSGSWSGSSSTGHCSGHWEAERRG
jgi:hypothetical protein